MLSTSRNSSRFLQIWLRPYITQKHSFCTLSKQERQQQLAEKYPSNTKLPKKIGQHANITPDELVYSPKIKEQLNPQFYGSHLLNKDKNADLSKVCIYQYKKPYLRRNKSELMESLQFGIFAIIALGAPATLFGTMYKWPEWSNKMISYMTFEGFFYWTQAGCMAFLVAAFFVALKYQTRSWINMIKRKIYGSTAYISSISIYKTNILNIQYHHNTLFNKKRLSHNIDLSDHATKNQLFYLKPSINAITESADIEVMMDLPDNKGNIIPIEIPMDGTVINWETFITFLKDIPNPAGKFKPVQVDKDGYIPVCKYKELLLCPRTTLNVYCHGIPPYKKKNTYLFVPNLKKDKLFVLYDHCKARNQSLIHKASFYENKSQTYLHCNSCVQARNKMIKPLISCIEWKLDDTQNMEEATVLIKVDASIIKNPLQFTDAFGHCPLETLMGFYCTNSFRLTHPKKPQSINDIYILGEMEQFNDWKDEHSPSIASLQSQSKNN